MGDEEKANNWPICYPVMRNSIRKDVPDRLPKVIAILGYGGWYATFAVFAFNFLVVSALLFMGNIALTTRLENWLASAVWFCCCAPCTFAVYRVLYFGCKGTSSMFFMVAAVLYLVLGLVMAALALGFLGTGGIIPLISVYDESTFVALLNVTMMAVYGAFAVYDFVIVGLCVYAWKKRGGSSQSKVDWDTYVTKAKSKGAEAGQHAVDRAWENREEIYAVAEPMVNVAMSEAQRTAVRAFEENRAGAMNWDAPLGQGSAAPSGGNQGNPQEGLQQPQYPEGMGMAPPAQGAAYPDPTFGVPDNYPEGDVIGQAGDEGEYGGF